MAKTAKQVRCQDRQRLVIVGTGEQAEIAYEYLSSDSQHDVVGFCVEEEYREKNRLYDLPVVNFQQVSQTFPQNDHSAFVAVSHTNINQLRRRLYERIKSIGYQTISYISSNSLIDESVKVGENCFIFEGVTIQRKCRIGDGVSIWSGSTIAHRSELSDFVSVAPEVSVAGFSEVGRLSFLGTNSTVADNIHIGANVLLGAGAVAISDLPSGNVFVGNPAEAIGKTSEYRTE